MSAFLELAEKVLTDAGKPLTPREIWNYATERGWDRELGSSGKTPKATLASLLYTATKKPKSPYLVIEDKPKRFYLRSKAGVIAAPVQENLPQEKSNGKPAKKEALKMVKTTQATHLLERDLHPFLTYFGHHILKCHCKTINHSKSEKKSFGEWVHPDMVGCVFAINDWDDEVLQLSSAVGNTSVKFISFELKRNLSLSNLREYFFQTVSNSSWANEAYIVAANISEDTDFHTELRRLSSSFGVGVIRLNVEDPDKSEIVYAATHRGNLDWDTLNKLTDKNSDFKQFVKRVRIDLKSNEIRNERYDKVLKKEQLLKR
jgi:hypothetical protein